MENNNTALEGVKKMIADGIVTQEAAEKYFPELRESEDEKILGVLKEGFEIYNKGEWYGGITNEQILAWLEKHGEQKPDESRGMNLVEEKMTPFQREVFGIIDLGIEEDQGLKQVCDKLLALASDEIEQKSADTWKPSEEQIKELEFFISELPKCSVTAQKIVKKGKDTLVSLLSDLKKLREE